MKNRNLPAFVVPEEQFDRSLSSPSIGLTKREYFIGLAFQSMIADRQAIGEQATYGGNNLGECFAKTCVAWADAMMTEMEKSDE